MRTILARELFGLYPHSDSLPVDPPDRCESVSEFRDRTLADLNDGILKYLVIELSDTAITDGVEYLNSAIKDLESVRDGLAAIVGREQGIDANDLPNERSLTA